MPVLSLFTCRRLFFCHDDEDMVAHFAFHKLSICGSGAKLLDGESFFTVWTGDSIVATIAVTWRSTVIFVWETTFIRTVSGTFVWSSNRCGERRVSCPTSFVIRCQLISACLNCPVRVHMPVTIADISLTVRHLLSPPWSCLIFDCNSAITSDCRCILSWVALPDDTSIKIGRYIPWCLDWSECSEYIHHDSNREQYLDRTDFKVPELLLDNTMFSKFSIACLFFVLSDSTRILYDKNFQTRRAVLNCTRM